MFETYMQTNKKPHTPEVIQFLLFWLDEATYSIQICEFMVESVTSIMSLLTTGNVALLITYYPVEL